LHQSAIYSSNRLLSVLSRGLYFGKYPKREKKKGGKCKRKWMKGKENGRKEERKRGNLK
jgi:hypothetical protein